MMLRLGKPPVLEIIVGDTFSKGVFRNHHSLDSQCSKGFFQNKDTCRYDIDSLRIKSGNAQPLFGRFGFKDGAGNLGQFFGGESEVVNAGVHNVAAHGTNHVGHVLDCAGTADGELEIMAFHFSSYR